jgi:ComF family protein
VPALLLLSAASLLAFALLLRSTPWVEPALEAADFLVPMPLSQQRLRERGYNQALLLAQQLAPGKCQAGWLLRLRDSPPQSSLGRTERLHSLAGAFVVEPLKAARLVGARVVLVDDVMTSGASLWAAAQAVRQAGATHITGLVVARTPER